MSEKVVAVDRALDLLLLLYDAGEEVGISDISRELGFPKSSVHRMLTTLEHKGFVHQNKENGKYWLGLKIYAMGLLVGERLSLVQLIRPYAKKLFDEFQEVVNVSILDKDTQDGYKTIVVLKESDTMKVLSVNPNVGASSDAHVSSVGKCLLAFSKDINLDRLFHNKLKKYTENTVVDKNQLINELEKIREQGYAIDNEEQEIGLFCIGAPILDQHGNAVAAISMSGPTARIKREDLNQKIDSVVQTANKITNVVKQLG
ncbi:IclR family transcriptional regulator [Clostridiaceae bacterium 35-E11]